MTKFHKWLIIKYIVVPILGIGVIAVGLFQVSKSRTFQFFGGLTSSVHTDQKVVALTFDDAPTEYTSVVLSILSGYGVKATFYAIGKNIESYPEETQAIIAGGHELGNHSYSHTRMVLKSLTFITNEIEKTSDLLRQAGYSKTITFRPPNGKKLFLLPYYLSTHSIQTVMWNIEPDTFVHGDSRALTAYTVDHVTPGSIILLHPLCANECQTDREALPMIIDSLRSMGYEFVTVSALLSMGK